MTQDEYLAAAKTKAIALIDAGNVMGGLASILGDLAQFPTLARHPDLAKLRRALTRRNAQESRQAIAALR